MIENIPLPRLLNDSGDTERYINPIQVSINLEIIPLSYASMTLPKGENLPARGYVELFTCMGSAGIYRVRSPQDAYGSGITTAELEHAIVEVGDFLVVDEYDEMMDAISAMTAVFRHYRGSKWTLGDISALGHDHIALEAKYVRVLEAMLAILEQKPDCMMTFDFSTSPRWTINIVKRGTTVAAEGRLARNVNYARVTYDDTELCTRAYYEKEATTDEANDYYPTFDQSKNYNKNAYVKYSGKLYQLPSGHAAGVTWANTTKTAVTDVPTSVWAYVDADTIGTYGLIEREVQTGSNYTAEEALYVAQEYLRTHKHPRISVEISLEELSSITGEPLDTFTIGKLCRLALSDYNVTVEKNITSLSFPNVYGTPRAITANLADEEDNTINFIHDVDASGGSGGGGGGGRKQDDQWKEYRTIFEQDDYHFGLYAQRLNTAEEILQQAGLYIDANGVLIFAEDNENMLGSRLQVEAGRITAIATRMANAEDILSQAGLEIDATTGVLIYHTDNANMLGAKMAVQAGKIEMVVGTTDQGGNYIKAGSITLAINNAGSSAMINADKIYLLGETIANTITSDFIQSRISAMTTLFVNTIFSNGLITSSLGVAGDVVAAGSSMAINGNSFTNLIKSASVSGNVLTLTPLSGNAITFSKATTQSGAWSSGVFTATAKQNSTDVSTLTTSITGGQASWSGKTVTIPIYATIGSSATVYNTGKSVTATYSGGTADYNQGWNDCIDTIKNGYGHTVLTGYSTYNNGSSTSLYVAPTGGASMATGAARVWRYGGSTATRYTLPDKK